MSHQNLSRRHASRFSTSVRLGVAAVAACFLAAPVLSNPVNPVVVNGTASFKQAGNVLTVTNSNGAIINWDKFSIKAGETTHFAQTAASSSVLNRVLNDPSAIYGTLSSNGRVWLVNPAGIMVGPGGRVDTAAFVASTLAVSNQDFLAGRHLFVNEGAAKDVINQGEIRTPAGGSVYLIGSNASNEGIITTPGGETLLAAGATVSLIDSATPGIKVDITGAQGNATNLGAITAEAGRIGIAGVIVRNSGTLNASTVVNEGGRIFLRASKDARVDGNGRIVTTGTTGGRIEVLGKTATVTDKAEIDASGSNGGGRILIGGDYQGKNPEIPNAGISYFGPDATLKADATKVGAGGTVIVWADDTTQAHGRISAQGGKGGFVETSGRQRLSVQGLRVNTGGGQWLLDPNDFTIGVDISGADLSTNLASNNVTILSSDGGASGNGDIFVNESVGWGSGFGLKLSAFRNIEVNQPISGGPGAGIVLRADDTGTGTGTVSFGASGSAAAGYGGQINLYYNPTSYSSPTNYSGTLSGSSVAWMLVNDVNDLQGMNANVAGSYALGKDVDASATSGWNGGAGFQPVGGNFTGKFDGLGHIISGLTINQPAQDYVGLFGYAGAGSVIRNVGLVGSSLSGRWHVGGLAGNTYLSTISNTYSTGSVSVSGTNYVGGLVGYNGGAISNSYSAAGVTASGDYVGGLVGLGDGGSIANSYSTSAVSGGNYVGGLVGYSLSGSIGNSYSTGSVSGTTSGGLIGFRSGTTVNNSYWDINTSGLATSSGGSGLTTAQAMQPANHTGWDFANVWYMVGNSTRPILRSEYSTRISNAHQLQLVGMNPATLAASYVLSADIGMGELVQASGVWSTASGFVPIGDATVPFSGQFDGQGHAISGLVIDRPATEWVGLFGKSGGVIGNIGLAGGSVSGLGQVGALVGENSGTISTAYSTASVTGGDGYDIGGLVGFNQGGTVTDSSTSSTVTGGAASTRTGGLVGANWGTVNNSHATGMVAGWREVGGLVGGNGGAIINSYATGAVGGTGDDVGGLVGRAWYVSVSGSHATGNVTGGGRHTGGLIGNNEAVVADSYAIGIIDGSSDWYTGGLIGSNTGMVTSTYASGAVTGASGVGGLIGLNNTPGSVAQSYATGPVSGINDVGGLIGENRAPVENSYATGAASGTDRVGGLTGWNSSTIDSSYAVGLVSASGANRGGLVGTTDTGSVINSFWDVDTTGQATSAGGGIGLNTAAMKTAATFVGAGWSGTVWVIADGAYPTLANMPSPGACAGYENCWTGAVDNLWATAGNWSAGHVPTGAEAVKLDVAGTPTITLAGVNPSFGSLWLAENLDVDAGVTFALSNLFTLASGTATFNGAATVHSYAQTGGTLAGSGDFTITTSFSKTGGAIDRVGSMSITQAVGALNFAATQAGHLNLTASTIHLGPVAASGGISLVTDSLTVSGATSSWNVNIQPLSLMAIVFGRSDLANTVGLTQASLDNLGTGFMYLYGNSFTVDSGSTTPVVLAGLTDYFYPAIDQITISSPLTLSQPGTALYFGARQIDISAAVTAGSGGVFLGKNASNVAYLVGVGAKTYPANTVELSNAELNRIVTSGPVIIGDPYNAHNSIHGPMQIVGPIDLTGVTSQLRLVGNGLTQAAGATITVPQLAVDGYGSISLPEANHVGTFAAKTVSGSIAFANAGPLAIGKVATTASPSNFTTSGVVAGNGNTASVSANGAMTLSAGAGATVAVSGAEVWLTFNGDLNLNAASGGQAYVEATMPATIHLDFSNSAGQVKFNGAVATAATTGLAGPGTPDFIGFWDEGVAAVPGSTLLLANTSFSFAGGGSCPGFDNCWTGAVNSLWATGGNWSAGHAPTGTEAAKVDVAGTPTISIAGVNPSFGSLWLAENLSVDAGVTFMLGNLFTLNAGTATFNGTASVHDYAQTGGTLAGSGMFMVANSFSRTGGSIDRSGAMDITQATGNLAFSAINVGTLRVRAYNGDIVLGPVTANSHVVAAAGRNLSVSGRVRSEGSIGLASGANHDGSALSASGYGGNIVLASGAELSAGDGVTYSGKDITLVALPGSDALGSITQNTGSTVGGDAISFHGAGSVALNGSVTAVNYSPAALNVAAGTNYLAPSTRTQYGGDVLIGGNLDAQDVNIVANGGLSGSAGIVQTAPSIITVRGGQMTATGYGDALLNGSMIAHDAPVTILAGRDSIAASDIAGKNVSLGRIEAAGAYITATGAILDGNGDSTNIVATWPGGPVIQLRSKGGGSPGSLAISADTVTIGSITATVDGGAASGGIFLRNASATTPTAIALTDGAISQAAAGFYQDGALALGSGHAFNAGSGAIAIGSGGSLSGIETARFGGTPAQIALISGQELSLSNSLIKPSAHIGLSAADGVLDIGHALSGAQLTLYGAVLNVSAPVAASGDLVAGGGVMNINGDVSAQNVALGVETLNIGNIGGTGGIRAVNQMLATASGDANITGGYLTTRDGDLEMVVGGNLNIGNASRDGMIYAGHDQLASPTYYPDASLAVGGKLVLTNGASIRAANDVYLDLLGSGSTVELNGGPLGPSYILSDIGTGVVGTTFLTFLARDSGGVLIDGVATTNTLVGGSGFFALNTSTPAVAGAGLSIIYAPQANDSIAAQLVTALNQAVESATVAVEEGALPVVDTSKKDATCSDGSFGCEEEDKDKKTSESKDEKKDEKAAQKKVAQCM